MNNIDVIILCGGKGTRLHSVVNDRPKSMALINSKPFLFYLLKQISSYGFKRVTLCTGYKSDFISEKFSTNFLDMKIRYSKEKEPLGTGGAVKLALSKVNSDYIMVMNGDSYVDVDLFYFYNWFINAGIVSGILLTEVKDVSRYGRVILGKKSIIKSFKEKGKFSENGLINAGIYLFKKDLLLKKIPKNVNYSLENQFFPTLLTENKLLGKKLSGKFIDIGTPKSYSEAGKFFNELYTLPVI